MFDIYIVQVRPAYGWGEDFFYYFHDLGNARAKIAELAKKYGMKMLNPDFAVRRDNYDVYHWIEEVQLSSEENFED